MNTQEKHTYWQISSINDFTLAQELYNSGRYAYSLFFCHLTLEKLLKSYIVLHEDKTPPFDHNLVRLAEMAEFILDKETIFTLTDITTFNIKGRYDDYKNEFYHKATKDYAEEYIHKTQNLIIWFKENFPKK
jgi:HEPN domain-containing protein